VVATLRSRYVTPYGPELDLRTFQCRDGTSSALEQVAFHILKEHRLYPRHELFHGGSSELADKYERTLHALAYAETPARPRQLGAWALEQSLLEGATTTEQAMLAVPPVTSEAEFDELRARVHGNEAASSDDKWRFYVAAYQQAWCVGRIDAAFLVRHGTLPAAPRVKLLACVLCPELRNPRSSDVSLEERSAIFKVPVVEDTIAALGLLSPFDDQTIIPDLLACFNERLRALPMWQDYVRHVRLFRQGPNAGVHGEWDLAKAVKSVNMVLSAAGLSLVGTTVRVQLNKVRSKTITYRLGSQGVEEMLELVKLRLTREGYAPANEHARLRIQECKLPRWGHLVPANGMPWGLCFSDDDDYDV
jgi:hypothetical protein